MIDLYYWTTPNGFKISLFLEEAALPYRIIPVNINKGEQFEPAFLKISPNNKIPAIVDNNPIESNEPIAIFESGAILLYLAQKTNKFIAQDKLGYYTTLEWLFWQSAGLGPMSGQYNHFAKFAHEKINYAIERYQKEIIRLYGVLDKQLSDRPYIAGEYSIADMSCYPWISPFLALIKEHKLIDITHIERWHAAIAARPAVQRVYAQAKEINPAL